MINLHVLGLGWGCDSSCSLHLRPMNFQQPVCPKWKRRCSSVNRPVFLLPPLPLWVMRSLVAVSLTEPQCHPYSFPLPGSSLMSHRRFSWKIIHSTHLFIPLDTFLKSDFLLLLPSTFPGHLVTFCLNYHPSMISCGLVVRTPRVHCRGSVPSLVGNQDPTCHMAEKPSKMITPIQPCPFCNLLSM